MNYLDLVRRTAQEAGMTQAPTTTVNQAGEFRRVCDWVADAWNDIESDQNREWSWMWEAPLLTLLAGTCTIANDVAPTRYAQRRTFDQSADAGPYGRCLDYFPWETFSLMFPVVTTQPGVNNWSIRPDNMLVFDAIVPVDRLIRVERFRNPHRPTADADVPGMPADLHMMIVWRAIMDYATFDEAGTQRAGAKLKYAALEPSLLQRCLPQITLGGPLL